MLEDIAVVGDQVKRHPVVGGSRVLARKFPAGVIPLYHQRDPEKARYVGIQHAESVPACAHIEVGVVEPVDGHPVAQKPVGVEGREPELAARIVDLGSLVPLRVLAPGLSSQFQVDVVVPVPPAALPKRTSAREPQVDPVVDALVAAVDRAVHVEHRGVALVDVLCGVVEHVVVEPVRAHDLAPVPEHVDAAVFAALLDALPATGRRIVVGGHSKGARGVLRELLLPRACLAVPVTERGRMRNHERLAWLTRGRRTRIAGVGIVDLVSVERIVRGQDHRPVVVVVLAREEERLSVAVALSRVVAVVLVSGDEVVAEAAVGVEADRERVVVPKQDALAVACLEQLWRKGAVEGPECLMVLDRNVRVEPDFNPGRRAVEPSAAATGRGVPLADPVRRVGQRIRPGLAGRLLAQAGTDLRCNTVHGVVVEATGRELAFVVAVALGGIAQTAVGACTRHDRLGVHRGEELVPALVPVLRSLGAAVAVAADPAWLHREKLSRVCVLDALLPVVGARLEDSLGLGLLGRIGVDALSQQIVERRAVHAAARAVVSISVVGIRQLQGAGLAGLRVALAVNAAAARTAGTRERVVIRGLGQRTRAELLEAHQLLAERRRAEERAVGAIGGDVAGSAEVLVSAESRAERRVCGTHRAVARVGIGCCRLREGREQAAGQGEREAEARDASSRREPECCGAGPRWVVLVGWVREQLQRPAPTSVS